LPLALGCTLLGLARVLRLERQAATNARLVCPAALIAALLAAYSASH